MQQYELKLYVCDVNSHLARRSLAELERVCEVELQGLYRIEVIDVEQHPDLAEENHILVTPTLIKELPPPLGRIVGDLSDKENLLRGLELHPL